MKAIQIIEQTLSWTDAPDPTCGPGEVLIQVHTTAVNRADLVQRSGNYPPPPGASPIMGLECAGEVTAIGEGVTRVAVGDAVCALLAGGGYAQQVAVPAGQVLPVPDGFNMQQAAAVPEVFATAYLNLYMEAGLRVGERVLIHAGASGVGTAALQLLRSTHNPAFVTAGSADKIERCRHYGADAGFDRHQGGFVEAVRAWAGEDGVDVILDPVGAGYLSDNLNLLGLGGRLVVIGLMGGAQADVNLGLMMIKRLRLIGSTLRARPISEKAAVMDALYEHVWPRLASGEIEPVIETVLPITDAHDAHELIASDATVGKVILTVPA